MNKKIYIAITIIILGIAAYFLVRGNSAVSPTLTPEPTSTLPPTLTPFPSSPTGFRGPTGLIERGSCTLSGSIKFISKDTFASEDAKISYKNIDSDARLIKWVVSPSEDLSVGPNLFGALDIPDGARAITLRLPENPRARQYRLTASVTYGEYINNNVEIRESRCSGSIPVTLAY